MLKSVPRTLSILGVGLAVFCTASAYAQHRPASSGVTNSNGPTATDRDLGRERAQDRTGRATTNANPNGINAIDRDLGTSRAQDRGRK